MTSDELKRAGDGWHAFVERLCSPTQSAATFGARVANAVLHMAARLGPLLPCPFCGCGAADLKVGRGKVRDTYVECVDCGACGPRGRVEEDGAAGAWLDWNSRDGLENEFMFGNPQPDAWSEWVAVTTLAMDGDEMLMRVIPGAWQVMRDIDREQAGGVGASKG